jgi:2-Cys peroxiredoxin 5
MTPRISSGDRIPQAMLGQLVGGVVREIDLQALLGRERAVIVGIPGAFTPVCTCEHVPSLLTNVARFRANRVKHIICVAPDNPWAVDAWARAVDPEGRLVFLSDGNLSLARALGVNVVDRGLFLGEVSTRYMLLADGGCVRRLTVESGVNDLTCTRSEDVVFID